MQWYRRRFSDPEAIALLVILLPDLALSFSLVACLLRCWWHCAGLFAGMANRAPAIYWLLRRWATSIVLVVFVGILLLMASWYCLSPGNRAST